MVGVSNIAREEGWENEGGSIISTTPNDTLRRYRSALERLAAQSDYNPQTVAEIAAEALRIDDNRK